MEYQEILSTKGHESDVLVKRLIDQIQPNSRLTK